VCMRVVSTCRADEEWIQKGERPFLSEKSNVALSLGVQVLFRLVPDVLHCGLDLIKHDIHKSTSARLLFLLLVVA
jgi:hypothetical protein